MAVYTGTRPGVSPAIRAGKGWRGRRELAPRCSATRIKCMVMVHRQRFSMYARSAPPPPPPHHLSRHTPHKPHNTQATQHNPPEPNPPHPTTPTHPNTTTHTTTHPTTNHQPRFTNHRHTPAHTSTHHHTPPPSNTTTTTHFTRAHRCTHVHAHSPTRTGAPPPPVHTVITAHHDTPCPPHCNPTPDSVPIGIHLGEPSDKRTIPQSDGS